MAGNQVNYEQFQRLISTFTSLEIRHFCFFFHSGFDGNKSGIELSAGYFVNIRRDRHPRNNDERREIYRGMFVHNFIQKPQPDN